MSVANNEDDVTRSICCVALELRQELEAAKLTLSKRKSLIVSNRKSLAKRVRRTLRVNDLHIPVADTARDLGIDVAGGSRRRRSTRNQRLRAAGRRGGKVRLLVRKNRRAARLYTAGILPSIADGVEQYGLSPADLKQFRSTAAACPGVSGHQVCPVTVIEIILGQHQTQQYKRDSENSCCGSVSGMRAGKCTNLFERRGSWSTPDSKTPRNDGIL